MMHLFYILFNVSIGTILLYTFYDPEKAYKTAASTVVCLDEKQSIKTFCAQCTSRINQIEPDKAFIIDSNENIAVLKIRIQGTPLACNQYLQLPNYEKYKSIDSSFQLENEQSISQLINQIEGVFTTAPQQNKIIGSEFEQFVIYRWFEANQERNTVVKAPTNQIQYMQHIFLYIVNIIIVLFFTLYLYNKELFSHLKPKILVSIAIYIVLIEVLTLNLTTDKIIIEIIRIGMINILLMRIDINKLIIILALIIGIAFRAIPLLLLVYQFLIIAIIFVKGFNEQNTKQIWRYIIFSLLLFIGNQLWWIYKLQQLADTPCRFVELTFLVLTPIGLVLIKDAKYVGFDIYKPGDQKKHSISLSGYEEEDEEDESGI